MAGGFLAYSEIKKNKRVHWPQRRLWRLSVGPAEGPYVVRGAEGADGQKRPLAPLNFSAITNLWMRTIGPQATDWGTGAEGAGPINRRSLRPFTLLGLYLLSVNEKGAKGAPRGIITKFYLEGSLLPPQKKEIFYSFFVSFC